MMHQQRQFAIRIDPTGLETSVAHFTEIKAFDSRNPSLGPLFRVPITTIVPLTVDSSNQFTISRKLRCKPAVPERLFIHVPDDADWATLKVLSLDDKHQTKYVVHCVQLLPNLAYRSTEYYKTITLEPNSELQHAIKLRGGRTLELCVTKWWANLGEALINVELAFHGIVPIPRTINVMSSEMAHRFDIRNGRIRYEDIQPGITFRHLSQPVRVSEVKLQPLGPRDLFDNGSQTFRLLLSYSFSIAKATEVFLELPGLTNYLYENSFDDVHIMLFTSTKQFVGSSSSYPKRYPFKLEKGEYRARVQIRHEDESLLDKYRDLTMIVKSKLITPINLECYANLESAVTGDGKKLNGRIMKPGEVLTVFLGQLPDDKVPKNVTAGCYLQGMLTIPKLELARSVVQYRVIYTFNEWGRRQPKALSCVTLTKKKDETSANTLQEMNDSLRDAQIAWLSKLKNPSEADELFEKLIAQYPNHLPLMQAQLKRLGDKKVRFLFRRETFSIFYSEDAGPKREQLMSLVDAVLSVTKPDEVLKYLGTKQECNETDIAIKAEMDGRRAAIVDALLAKANCLADAHLAISTEEIPKSFRSGLILPVASGNNSANHTKDTNNTNNKEDTKQPSDMSKKSSVSDFQVGFFLLNCFGLLFYSFCSFCFVLWLFEIVDEMKAKEKDEPVVGELVSLTESEPLEKSVAPMVNAAAHETSVDDNADKQVVSQNLPKVTLKDLDIAYYDVMKWLEPSDTKALILGAKQAVAHTHYGRALKFLRKASEEKPYINCSALDMAIIEVGFLISILFFFLLLPFIGHRLISIKCL
ncbi:unnamed protein product [Anisakis simplex]|uniref:Uncharacterized protein n=1 Tax=Anisakis simplex TaxID=6269 RepID=A0A3P6R6F4_ANISI|nr:unnamed protein product [Anisakis simplex]